MYVCVYVCAYSTNKIKGCKSNFHSIDGYRDASKHQHTMILTPASTHTHTHVQTDTQKHAAASNEPTLTNTQSQITKIPLYYH